MGGRSACAAPRRPQCSPWKTPSFRSSLSKLHSSSERFLKPGGALVEVAGAIRSSARAQGTSAPCPPRPRRAPRRRDASSRARGRPAPCRRCAFSGRGARGRRRRLKRGGGRRALAPTVMALEASGLDEEDGANSVEQTRHPGLGARLEAIATWSPPTASSPPRRGGPPGSSAPRSQGGAGRRGQEIPHRMDSGLCQPMRLDRISTSGP